MFHCTCGFGGGEGWGKVRTEEGVRNRGVNGKCGRLKIGSEGQSVDAHIRCYSNYKSENSLNHKHYFFKELLSKITTQINNNHIIIIMI